MTLSDPDARPAPGEVLCRLDQIPDGGALGLSYGSGVKRFKIVLFRRADALFAYINECSHLTSPLELRPGQFLISEDGHVYCGAHGAGFRIADGACINEVCAGKPLIKVPVEVIGGAVVMAAA